MSQLDLFELTTWSVNPDESISLWLTYDISPDDGTTDTAFAEMFENKYGYQPDGIVRESYGNGITRVFVGPVRRDNEPSN